MSRPDDLAATVLNCLNKDRKSIRWLARTAGVGYANLHGWLRGNKCANSGLICKVLRVMRLHVAPRG